MPGEPSPRLPLLDEPFSDEPAPLNCRCGSWPNLTREALRAVIDEQRAVGGITKGQALFHADRIGDTTTVYVVEGEKDVLAIEAAGGAAVCSAMGAGKAHRADWSPLSGNTVVVVADKDDLGRKHAAKVVELLDGIAASVRIVEATTGKDAADHIAAGHGLDEFSVYTPPTPPQHRNTPATSRCRLLRSCGASSTRLRHLVGVGLNPPSKQQGRK